MSTLGKVGAVALLIAALILGLMAYRMAVAPPPEAPAAPVVEGGPRGELSPVPSPTHPVLVAATAISAGQPIAADAVMLVNWPVPVSQGFDAPQLVIGKALRTDAAVGEPILRGQLVMGLSTYLKEDERAVAVAVDDLVGVANAVNPGDMVDIFVTLDKNDEVAGGQTRLMQARVRVLAFGSRSVDGPIAPPANASGGMGASARTAILAVPLDRVNELLLAAKAGRLQFALRSPKDETVPDRALFNPRAPVLAARAGLTTQERAELAKPENAAFAGDSLVQLGGAKVAPAPAAPVAIPSAPRAAATTGPSRSIEVIRGGQSETVRY